MIASKNKANLGIEGKIIDETKQTLLFETTRGKKRLFKKIIIIELKLNNSKVRINGALLVGRAEERIKVK